MWMQAGYCIKKPCKPLGLQGLSGVNFDYGATGVTAGTVNPKAFETTLYAI